ncbi:S-adenosyl methyltransferase [Micromonospora pisi]|uniref:S-adenosyl methyltransferase n=1 Tax=Micromonospora pisi TaxID=589240 RepID=A0A495JHR8_9ACTN|nr:SAM-dependent methyltransferase [Micromonospora pisi]RKR87589.1 S-adenosyl methyltransferase [Micromonospora pisi]
MNRDLDQAAAATVPQIYRDLVGGQASQAADRIVATNARVTDVARANRAWLQRVVRCLADRGVTQFLDIGSGVAETDSVHEIAQGINPATRVLYVDIDPETVRLTTAALHDNARTAAVAGDVNRIGELLDRLNAPDPHRVLDLDEPVAVLLAAVLHFVPDHHRAADALAALRDRLAPGSYLAISHGATEAFTAQEVARLQAVYRETSAVRPTPRDRQQVAGFFGDFEMLDPGVTWVSEWRPDGDPELPTFAESRMSGLHVGLARKR